MRSLHVQENLTFARCRMCLLNSDSLVVSDPLGSNLVAGSTASGLCQVPNEFTHHAVAYGAPMELCHDCFRLATVPESVREHDHFETILV